MNKRRQSLKRQHAFADAVTRAIREAGGVELEGFGKTVAWGIVIGAKFQLETRVGLAVVSAAPSAFCGDDQGQPGGGQLYITFKDVARACAAKLPYVNNFSGKWHHQLWNLEPEEAYEHATKILRSIAVEVPA